MIKGASTGSREPNPQAVSALSGFDPERERAHNRALSALLDRLAAEQKGEPGWAITTHYPA